jgi:hypothetical protein
MLSQDSAPHVFSEEYMNDAATLPVGTRRNEDIALDMMKFIAITTGYGKTGSAGAGFGASVASKPEDYAIHLLELYGRCLSAVERKK